MRCRYFKDHIGSLRTDINSSFPGLNNPKETTDVWWDYRKGIATPSYWVLQFANNPAFMCFSVWLFVNVFKSRRLYWNHTCSHIPRQHCYHQGWPGVTREQIRRPHPLRRAPTTDVVHKSNAHGYDTIRQGDTMHTMKQGSVIAERLSARQ